MTIYDDLAKTILTVTTTTPVFPPASLAFGLVTAARYRAPGTGEVEVQGIVDGILPIPLRNCTGTFITKLAANPAGMVGREVMVVVGSQRACIVDVMGV